MPGDPSLAKLLRDFGERWEIERVEPGTEWVACQRDQWGRYNGSGVIIVSAHDLDGLRCEISDAEQDDVG
jgi:hypothetical protein